MKSSMIPLTFLFLRYASNILVYCKFLEEPIEHLQRVLMRRRKHRLHQKIFCGGTALARNGRRRVVFLGFFLVERQRKQELFSHIL